MEEMKEMVETPRINVEEPVKSSTSVIRNWEEEELNWKEELDWKEEWRDLGLQKQEEQHNTFSDYLLDQSIWQSKFFVMQTLLVLMLSSKLRLWPTSAKILMDYLLQEPRYLHLKFV